mmetsp:Transcript_7745/g.15573  ORF Transcript_7745/g.15573 Transcript_7745/m.15573 type:complete len:234 (+) Transcript_7745:387-1088(+)
MLFIHVGECLQEHAIVLFQNSILGGQVQGPFPLTGILEARVRKPFDGGLRIVHTQCHAWTFEIVDFHHLGRSPVCRCKGHFQLAWARSHKVCGPVLISKRMATDHDRLLPPTHQTRNIINHNRLAKHGPIQDIPNGSIGTPPHLLQLELLHPCLIWRDGRTLDPHVILFNRLGRIHGDLIVRRIPTRHTQVVIFGVHLDIWEHQLGLDRIPNHPSHLIPIDIHHRIIYRYLVG